MSAAFSAINPHLYYNILLEMFYMHLDLTKSEVAKRLSGDYAGDIEAFGEVEQEALSMADMFTMGIFEQFPNKF
jgi:hypothetical protein